MSCPDLGEFWSENKDRIGRTLSEGVEKLAEALQTGADMLGLTQEVVDGYVHWTNREGKLVLVFCVVPDPRDIGAVLNAYLQAKQNRPALTAVFVHQWTDGEGNWDVFVITAQRAMQHVDRISGSDRIQQRDPVLRDDLYTLFACDPDFPEPGREEWADLLAGPMDGIAGALGRLADERGCIQTVGDSVVQWSNAEGRIEAQFFILPDPEEIDAYIAIYRQIRKTSCPVSFVFVKCREPRTYDIFRLSARSYLEHHNQVKGRLRLEMTGDGKVLEELRWVPRWASHVGCIKGCLNYLGSDVSDAWLFGATGHAFVLNISPGLCPSGPTDWDTSGFLRLGRNLGYRVESVDAYCPRKQDPRAAQERAWDHVRRSIDAGLSCYGWELDVPEYYVIYGYDKTGYYISGPGCDEGAGPVSWQKPGTSEIGVVLVSSVQRAKPADTRKTVRQALSYALDLAHNRRKWTERTGGMAGYNLWIETMEQGKAGRFGLGYNAAVWAESRKFAVAFLHEAQQRLNEDLHGLFNRAISQYEKVAQSLKEVSDAYPFTECKGQCVGADDRRAGAVENLRQAREAETAGLRTLAEVVAELDA